MKLAASAFALVLASGVAAYAQGTGTPSSPSATPSNSNQCWDMATNTVKNSQGKTLSQGANTSPGTAANTNPSTPPGSSASSGSSSSSSTTGSATTKPPGMPNC